MPTDSSRLLLAKPLVGDSVSQLRLSITDVIDTLDPIVALDDQGSSNPAAGTRGKWFKNTVTGKIYRDDGTTLEEFVLGTDARLVKRPSFTFTMDEDTPLPVAGKVIARFYAPAGTIIKVRHSVLSGTSSVLKLQKNTVDIAGLTSVSPTTSAATSTPSGTETTAELDEIRLVCVTQGSGKGLAASVFIDV